MENQLIKYNKVINELSKVNIIYDGLIDDMIQTCHKDNPKYKLKQNPIFWKISSSEEIINSITSALNND